MAAPRLPKEDFPVLSENESLFIRQCRDYIARKPQQINEFISHLYSATYGFPSMTTLRRWTGLPKETINGIIAENEDRQTHRIQFTKTNEPKLVKTFNARYANDVWQIDLIDLKSIFSNFIDPNLEDKTWGGAVKQYFPAEDEKHPTRFCLVVIDTYSRKVFVETTIGKSATEVCNAMISILEILRKTSPHAKPNVIYCDYGAEFMGDFRDTFRDMLGIKFFHPRNQFEYREGKKYYLDEPMLDSFDTKYEGHCAMVERVNRTLKEIVFKVLRGNSPDIKSMTMSRFMKAIANIYNSRYHSSIGMAPNQKYDGTAKDVRKHRQEFYMPKPVRLPKYAVDDYVYLKYQSRRFDKGYIEKFDPSTSYRIVRRNPRMNKDGFIFFTYDVQLDDDRYAEFYEEMLTK